MKGKVSGNLLMLISRDSAICEWINAIMKVGKTWNTFATDFGDAKFSLIHELYEGY